MRDVANRALGARVRQRLRGIFTAWASVANERICQRERLMLVVNALWQSKMLAAFQGWAARSIGRARFKDRLCATVVRWRGRRLAGCFDAWCAATRASDATVVIQDSPPRASVSPARRMGDAMAHLLQQFAPDESAAPSTECTQGTLLAAYDIVQDSPPRASVSPARRMGDAMAHLLQQFVPDESATPSTECTQGTLLAAYETVLGEVSNLEGSVAELEESRAKRTIELSAGIAAQKENLFAAGESMHGLLGELRETSTALHGDLARPWDQSRLRR